jgi:hypothetical protein
MIPSLQSLVKYDNPVQVSTGKGKGKNSKGEKGTLRGTLPKVSTKSAAPVSNKHRIEAAL